MKTWAFLGLAVVLTGTPALAASGSGEEAAGTRSERKICTQIQRRGGSRLAYQRVCLTEAEWRERLGPDWRIQLTGRSPEDDAEGVDMRARDFSNFDTTTGGRTVPGPGRVPR
jgi:hypothetical protein